MKWTLEKEFKFEASHQLAHHDGKCRRLHGHSWKGRVVVSGNALETEGPKQGMLLDYADLKKLLDPLVEQYLDHHHLNDILDNPTSEEVARWVWYQLAPDIPRRVTLAVVIDETCTSRCTFEHLRA